MDPKSATAIIFSPTGATRRVMDSIVKGTGIAGCSTIDLTSHVVLESSPPLIEGDLVLIGVPVYAMGVPGVLIPYLKKLEGRNQPVVLVAVYGNMSEGVALSQLRMIIEASGFHVVAAGSFVGEHTFSTRQSPVAAGRPGEEDLRKAEEFGRRVIEKMRRLEDLGSARLELPKRSRLLARLKMSLPFNTARVYAKAPVINRDLCNHCGLCARLCPTGAINPDTMMVQANSCLRCCCCVKRCPRHTRKMPFRLGLPVPLLLQVKGRKRHEPRIYL